ncbi:DUF6232 family protein [Chitinophaga sp. GbtcB8]|uniref:DUF6232 family protein n=1 Tax=Chitinophaga sp. GbtcB8 TaxID=2824753 RepID=UPI001C3060D6|nr:DUF6232 family protein [Chitinophaga sp. GbtcB8]
MSINSREKGGSPYQGSLIFTNHTLAFNGTTIQLRNVTRFGTREIKRTHKISPILLIASAVIFFLSLSWKGLGFISFIAAAVAGYGIYEFFRPKLYALIIELNSSYHHIFSSVDRGGIEEVHRRITSAMTSDKPVNTTVNFSSDKIIFGDHVARDKYEVNDSNIDKMGSFNNNP